MNIKNKVALVTGGAHRVGRAISTGLAAEGVKVGIHYHGSDDEAQEVLDHLSAAGGEAHLLKGDFANLDDIERVVNQCYEKFGQIDFLINNAAIYFKTPLRETTAEQWDQLFTINLKAPFFCAKYASGFMHSGGKIINIADVSGLSPWAEYVPYCTTKAGVIAITKGLAKELAPEIQVNAIAPGTVLLSEDASEEHARQIRENTLLKRIGEPQDIVATVLFLLKEGDYMTGQVIAVDGGSSLAGS